MSEEERRALWAAALGVPEHEVHLADPTGRDEAPTDEESLRRAG